MFYDIILGTSQTMKSETVSRAHSKTIPTNNCTSIQTIAPHLNNCTSPKTKVTMVNGVRSPSLTLLRSKESDFSDPDSDLFTTLGKSPRADESEDWLFMSSTFSVKWTNLWDIS